MNLLLNLALILAACLLATLLPSAGCRAADWPPTLDAKNPEAQSLDGRLIERFWHGPRPEWGYPESDAGEWGYPEPRESGPTQQNHNSFYLVSPQAPRPGAPLCVVLHSANRTAYDYLGFLCLNRKLDGSDDPASALTNSPPDFYALYLNSPNDEWWGYSQARLNPNYAKGISVPSPAELRVLDTIEWVAQRCAVDRNRIYLCGASMGGSGTLGLGLPHGEVFASILAIVPAGVSHASYRRGGFAPSPAADAPPAEREAWLRRAAGVGLPDPPVIVDFSSQQDNWAMTQPALVQAAVAGRLPLVLIWGPFGHAAFGNRVAKYPICNVGLAYPWLEIRRNEAYPVFTHASSDQHSPWLNAPVDFDSAGQMNAFFRWKSGQDTPTALTMQLWIAHPTVPDPPPAMPAEAVTDVTLRRLQQLQVRPGATYTWQLTRAGKVEATGQVKPDALNLLTIPSLKLTTVPADLTLTAVP